LTADTVPFVGDYTYAWDLDNNGTYETPDSVGTVTTHEDLPGTYTYGLLVTDTDLTAGDPKYQAHASCRVTVLNDPPQPSLEAQPFRHSGPVAHEAVMFLYS